MTIRSGHITTSSGRTVRFLRIGRWVFWPLIKGEHRCRITPRAIYFWRWFIERRCAPGFGIVDPAVPV